MRPNWGKTCLISESPCGIRGNRDLAAIDPDLVFSDKRLTFISIGPL
jgi:hypothetical protein